MPILTGGGVVSVEIPNRPISVEAPPSTTQSVAVILGPPGPPGDLTAEEAEVIAEAAVLSHELAAEPHPAYDDMQSLVVIFENGLF